jgi:hypothetical protein
VPSPLSDDRAESPWDGRGAEVCSLVFDFLAARQSSGVDRLAVERVLLAHGHPLEPLRCSSPSGTPPTRRRNTPRLRGSSTTA